MANFFLDGVYILETEKSKEEKFIILIEGKLQRML